MHDPRELPQGRRHSHVDRRRFLRLADHGAAATGLASALAGRPAARAQ